MTVDDVTLSEESIKRVEAGAAAHQAVIAIAEQRRVKLEEIERELKLANMDVDRLRVDVHDLTEKLAEAREERRKAESARVAYETFVALLARQLLEFIPPYPPLHVHRRETPAEDPPEGVNGGGEKREEEPAPASLPQAGQIGRPARDIREET